MAHSKAKKINLHEYKASPSVPSFFQDAETNAERAKTYPSKTVPDLDTEEDEDVPSIEAMIARMDAQKTLKRENNSPAPTMTTVPNTPRTASSSPTAYSEAENVHGAIKNSPGHSVTGSVDGNNYSLDGGGGRDSGRRRKRGASRSPSASNSGDGHAGKGLRKRPRVARATRSAVCENGPPASTLTQGSPSRRAD